MLCIALCGENTTKINDFPTFWHDFWDLNYVIRDDAQDVFLSAF